MIIGTAEVLVHANTKPFTAEVEAGTRATFTEVEREAHAAGVRTGAAMASGTRTGSAAMVAESRAAGAAAGTGMATHMEAGAARSNAAMVGVGATGKKVMGGLALAVAGSAFEAGHLAEKMQSTEATIAGASGTSVAAATKVGDAFLGTAGKSEFSGNKMAEAYAKVAGQLKVVNGNALNAGQAAEFMRATTELAVAKQIDLGVATATTSSILQAFQMDVSQSGHAADVLFAASNATGVSVDTLGTQIARLRSRLGDSAGSLADVAGLLVDMTNHGVTGRSAISGVTTGLSTLQKTAGAVTTAMKTQDQTFAQMPAKLQVLARGYQNGEISAKDYHKVVATLPIQQQNLMSAFARSAATVQTAQMKYKDLGVEVFDSHGKFVGMQRVIEQLNPLFSKMSQQQQIATASTLFGAGAARQMVQVVNAGPAAYAKATSAVSKHGQVQSAAAKQAKTMHGELKTLGATASDIGTTLGTKLIPIVTHVGQAFLGGTKYVLQHKTAAEALAVVIGGALSVAIGVFTVNKLGRMVSATRAAGTELKLFAATAAGVGRRVAASFGLQSEAAVANTARIEAAQAGERTAVTTTATTVQAENAATGRSFTMVGTSTITSAAAVETTVAAEATSIATADTAIEASNAAAAASFSTMLGPIGAVVAAAAALHALSPGGDMTSFIGKIKAWEQQVRDSIAFKATGDSAGRLNAYPDSHATATTGGSSTTSAAPPVSVAGIGAAVGGLTAKQKKQLASLVSGAGGGGAGGSGGSGTSGGKTSSGNAPWQVIAQALSGMGLSDVQIAGALGNFGAEAGGMTVKGISTTATNPTSGAYGFAQWLGARLTALRAFAKSQGLPASSLKAQVGFLEKELKGTEHGTLAALKGASTPAQAALIFEHAFERGGVSAGNMAQRQKLAGQALSLLTGSSSVKVPLYANPFAKAHGVHTGQTDMGVDYSMDVGSKIGAIGAGKVLGVTGGFQDPGGGNPNNGTYIAYQLTQGPNKGKVVYVAEQINSKVHAGQHLVAGQTIGTYAAHGSGIEMGFANPHNWRQTLAAAHGHGAYAVRHAPGGTIEGQMFSAMLRGIGSGVSQTVSASGAVTAPKLTAEQKHLVAVEKAVTGQENTFNRWLASQRATESIMTSQQKRALNEEIAIKRSALGIQTAQEFASTVTLTKQQKHSLAQQASDQKLGVAMMTKLVASSHEKNLKVLEANVAHINQAGFSSLVKRLEHSHTTGFAALAKQLVAVHKKAMDHLAAETIAAQKKTDAKIAAATDKAWASVVGYSTVIAKDKADAQVQAIGDATKVTLDQQAEVGKTGADLVAARAQTHLDQVTQTQDALVAVAQLANDQMQNNAAASETQKAQAAFDLQTAQDNASLAEAQAQAALDLSSAAASTADAAASAADAAASSADAADASAVAADPTSGVQPNFNFTIYGHGMSGSELMSEVGWALKTGALPLPAAA